MQQDLINKITIVVNDKEIVFEDDALNTATQKASHFLQGLEGDPLDE